jgi:hypothetical protein
MLSRDILITIRSMGDQKQSRQHKNAKLLHRVTESLRQLSLIAFAKFRLTMGQFVSTHLPVRLRRIILTIQSRISSFLTHKCRHYHSSIRKLGCI